MLKLGLHLRHDLVVEQLGKTSVPQQRVEHLGIQGQQPGPVLGMRQVLLVQQGAGVTEQERVGEGRRLGGVGLDDAHPAGAQALHETGESGQVVVLLEALARRLHADGEVLELAGGLKQLTRLDPLQPQGCAVPRPRGGHEQSARGALAEPGCEQRRLIDPAAHQGGDLQGIEDDELGAREPPLEHRNLQHDAVVGRDHLRFDPQYLLHPLPDRHRPGLVDAPPQRAVDDEPPTAGLVPVALQDQGLIGGQDPGGVALLAQQPHEIVPGMGVQPCIHEPAPQHLLRLRLTSTPRFLQPGLRLPQKDPLGEPGGRRPPQALAPPERQAGAASLGWVDDDAVACDLPDPPARRAQRDDVARAGLVDHLLVELAHPAPPGLLGPLRQHHREHAPVRDRARRRHGQPLRIRPGAEPAGGAVPHDPRREVGQVRRGEASGQQRQHRLEGPTRQ